MPETALILAGGDGMRLRPLTCTRPAAMLPVCGVPLIEYTVEFLKKAGYKDIIIAADRLSPMISEYFENDPAVDMIISPTPQGTCYALSEAAKILPEGGMVTVVYGNILFETDISPAEIFHAESAAEVTVITRKAVPSEDAVLAVSKDGRITEILPCAARENCRSDDAAAGIFIISQSAALDAFSEGEDILSDFIPALIKRGKIVMNFPAAGFFCPVNTAEGYFSANSAVMGGEISNRPADISEKAEDLPGLKIIPPVRIPASADIAAGAETGAGTVIGENVTVCRGARLHGAIVMDGAYIGERVSVTGAVIGSGARLLAGSTVNEGAIIGDSAVISEQAVIRRGVKIWNGRHIDAYATAAQDIRYGTLSPMKIGEDGIVGETGSIIDPQTAASVGSALASLGNRIGVGYKDSPASESLAMAIASGITAAGAEAWIFGETSEPELDFCVAKSGLAAGCRVDAGVTAKIKLCSGDGLPLSRSEEKIIEGGVNRSEYRRAGFMHFGKMRDSAAITRLYKLMLENTAPRKLTLIRAVLNTSGAAVNGVCEDILGRINSKNGKPVVFHIGSDGRGTSAYTDETGYIFEEKLILIACRRRFEQGENIALPYNFPHAAEVLAEKYGRKILRYSGCPSDPSDREARRLALETPFVRDGAALMFSVLEAMEAHGKLPAEEISDLPEMALSTRFIPIDRQPVRLLRSIFSERQVSGDGVSIDDRRGKVLIRPVKTGKGVIMQVESYSAEIAAELCDFYQDLICKAEP